MEDVTDTVKTAPQERWWHLPAASQTSKRTVSKSSQPTLISFHDGEGTVIAPSCVYHPTTEGNLAGFEVTDRESTALAMRLGRSYKRSLLSSKARVTPEQLLVQIGDLLESKGESVGETDKNYEVMKGDSRNKLSSRRRETCTGLSLPEACTLIAKHLDYDNKRPVCIRSSNRFTEIRPRALDQHTVLNIPKMNSGTVLQFRQAWVQDDTDDVDTPDQGPWAESSDGRLTRGRIPWPDDEEGDDDDARGQTVSATNGIVLVTL